jgi:hypothetical protein
MGGNSLGHRQPVITTTTTADYVSVRKRKRLCCTSIFLVQAIAGQEMAEIRVDLMFPAVSKEELAQIYKVDMPMIVTVREVGGQEGWGQSSL